ncbi:DUF6371 domain-containing protein [Sediminicoccus sp. KRV36]|uniref:DUF6371 domain-containing protein n=1 Tax=Sediminicoccus sp. KRV36 TaxID=3133721 RepID=UPI00200C85E4|nr:DUF6371 domain-containing protein [Sediminicoccus rosea]UPY35428.1 DUF6371 domain-containing protein [Sediminicoccus rosea]
MVDVILPAPLALPETIQHARHGVPAAVWNYRAADGALLFVACRFNKPDGGKEVMPYCATSSGWAWRAPPDPRPLYGLDRLAVLPDSPVLIVEGEKTADAAAALFPDHVAMTWQGGSNATGKACWSVLQGRVVAMWPDHDDAGQKAASAVRKALLGIAASVAVVVVPDHWPNKWDLADPLPDGVTLETLRAMLNAAHATTAEPDPEQERQAYDAALLNLAGMERHSLDYQREFDAVKRRFKVGAMAIKQAVAVKRADIDRRQAMEAGEEIDGATASGLDPDPKGREDLFISAADLPDTAAELAQYLQRLPDLFERGGPVRLAFDAQRKGMMAEPLGIDGVVNQAHRVCRPWRYRRDRDMLIPEAATLPERVAKLYLAARGSWGLNPLDGIASAPLLSDDGSLRVADGYDPTTRMWCERMPVVEGLPDMPSREDAAAALLRLRTFLRTFAFGDAIKVRLPGEAVDTVDLTMPPGHDESAALIGVMTAVCRPSLDTAPAVLYRAPAISGAGTGKGLLVRTTAAIAFGMAPSAMTGGGTPEEREKRITAALMEAGPVLFLDNVNGTALKSDTLASAITERPASVRPLGSSKTVLLNATAFIACTGNGLTLSEDLARRFLVVELDAGTEDPEARSFQNDIVDDAMAHRGELLRDVLTIWRWGRLNPTALKKGRPMSFRQWMAWCRDPLLTLGCADPAERIAEVKARDPQRMRLAELFRAWWQHHHDTPMAVKGLADDVKEWADPLNRGRQALAASIAKLAGTRAAGFALERVNTAGRWSADLYKLSRTEIDAPSGASHGEEHRGHREHRGAVQADPPKTANPAADADPYAHSGASEHREGIGGGSLPPKAADNLGSGWAEPL